MRDLWSKKKWGQSEGKEKVPKVPSPFLLLLARERIHIGHGQGGEGPITYMSGLDYYYILHHILFGCIQLTEYAGKGKINCNDVCFSSLIIIITGTFRSREEATATHTGKRSRDCTDRKAAFVSPPSANDGRTAFVLAAWLR